MTDFDVGNERRVTYFSDVSCLTQSPRSDVATVWPAKQTATTTIIIKYTTSNKVVVGDKVRRAISP